MFFLVIQFWPNMLTEETVKCVQTTGKGVPIQVHSEKQNLFEGNMCAADRFQMFLKRSEIQSHVFVKSAAERRYRWMMCKLWFVLRVIFFFGPNMRICGPKKIDVVDNEIYSITTMVKNGVGDPSFFINIINQPCVVFVAFLNRQSAVQTKGQENPANQEFHPDCA